MPRVSDEHLHARRRQIIDAAIVCFARDGFHRATMQDVCREAHLSAGAIYRYFSSKDAIIEAIADERHAREAEFMELARSAGGGADGIRALGRASFASLADPDERLRRRLGLQVWAEALRNPRIHKLVMRGMRPPRVAQAQIGREAHDAGGHAGDIESGSVAAAMLPLLPGFV